MKNTIVEKKPLKDLGTLTWKEALSKKAYYEQHMYSRIPNDTRELLNGEILEAELKNQTKGVKFIGIFDREYLLAKMSYFFTRFFYKREEFLSFCEEAWNYSNKERTEDTAILIEQKLKGIVDPGQIKQFLDLYREQAIR